MEQTIKNFNEESDVIIPNVYHIRRIPYIQMYEEVCWEYYDTAGNYHWQGTYTGCHEFSADDELTIYRSIANSI